VLPGSIYHALAKMESEGLLRTEARERTGDRVRTVYAITPAGTAALLDLLKRALGSPPHDLRSDLAVAAMWLTLLAPKEVESVLARAREQIEAARADRDRGRAAKIGLSPIVGMLLDNADEIADADLRLLDRLQEFVRSDVTRTARRAH
jgi:DNA-binding PadR family transcriptional regulator